jgi:hypothetical protein
MSKRDLLIVINLIVFNLGLFGFVYKKGNHVELPNKPPHVIVIDDPKPQPEPEPEKPINYTISNPRPEYLNYQATVDQLNKWHQEAPKLTEVSTYGKTSNGQDIYYMLISSPKKGDKKVVLITACIHGDEPLSSSVVMNYIGTILDRYGDDEKITELVDSRDIYFVPVVSPDSYPRSRRVDGVDPNRDFPTLNNPNKVSVPPIRALQQFFLKIKPNAAISGHTFGRIFLTPYGDLTMMCPNQMDYQRIMSKVSRMCRYGLDRACNNYGVPIYGTEVDWYYRNGAFSVVMEFGTHQRIPTKQEIDFEFKMTFDGVLLFITEAPEVIIRKRYE